MSSSDHEFLELVEKVYSFHTKRAPGIPIGVAMVQLAMAKLGKCKKIGAVTETQVCLSAAIQFLTGCTVGNKYLIMCDQIGRYALTLYDRDNGRGIRVYVDIAKIDADKMPETRKFFLRQRDPELRNNNDARAESAKIIVEEFMAAGRNIFGWQHVRVKNHEKPPVNPVKICPDCGESYICPENDSRKCLVCAHEMDYYEREN
jgi:formylmethanofuran dehydrogenase subunit E